MTKELLRHVWPGSGDKGKRADPRIVWVLLAAIVLLALSGMGGGRKDKEEKNGPNEIQSEDAESYVKQTEERLVKTLERIHGVGAVSVFIHIESGGEKILAADHNKKSGKKMDGEYEQTEEETEQSVVLSGQSAGQAPYVLGEKMPTLSGVLVVAEGARDEGVRNEIYEAVRAVFGLSAHRVKITY